MSNQTLLHDLSTLKANVGGIHLSGPNSPETSIVIMTGQFLDGNLKMSYVFEKIAAFGSLFSDDRLFELIKITSPSEVFVDCPLTVPPCVSCERSLCPGVPACEDMAVAMMQAIASGASKTRKRPLNPQTQRLWDVSRAYAENQVLQSQVQCKSFDADGQRHASVTVSIRL